MGSQLIVGISDQKIARAPDTLITYALGSCVGICLYDYQLQIGGLSHILLPESFADSLGKDLYKYANTAIEELVSAMERMGCQRYRLTAKIAGGANMFATSGMSIGDRNVEKTRQELQRLRIRLANEDTGLNYGRTVEFWPQDGTMLVKTIGKGIKTL